jgi:UDP-N-acetylmuramate dehydrogenase
VPELLAQHTTLRLGGPAREFVTATDEEALIAALREAGEDAFLLAGGSNVVVADEGLDATVVHVKTTGVEHDDGGAKAILTVQAGENWDDLVARAVSEGLAGIECLSGIPGSVGATPIQNVGAYGQDVAETITGVRVHDRQRDEILELAPAGCGFGYRSSRFKRDPGHFAVLSVQFALDRQDTSRPLRYVELANRLGLPVGAAAPLQDVRDAVLELRRSKGMVLDPEDPDTRSAGSFFTNPILTHAEYDAFLERAARTLGPDARPPRFPEPDGRVKTSAAWLIENAGFHKGFGDPRTIAISSKHSLALTNRGAGTTARLVALAREVAAGVESKFGLVLVPEPVFAGHHWRESS